MKPFIFFDLEGTLVEEPVREARFRAYWRLHGIELSERDVARAFHRADRHFMEFQPVLWQSGSRRLRQEHLRYVMEDVGFSGDPGKLADEPWTEWVPFPETPAVLTWLRDAGFGCGLIANAGVETRALLSRLALAALLKPVVISAEVGCAKPERRIFDLALSRAGVASAEALHVGDNVWEDGDGARGAGMNVLLLDRRPEWSGRALPQPAATSLWGVVRHVAAKPASQAV